MVSNRGDMPALVDVEAIAVPDDHDFIVNGRRHLLVTVTLFTESVTIHTVTTVGGVDQLPVHYNVTDDRGITYPRTGGGGGGYVDGSPQGFLTHFLRPDDRRPATLTVTWDMPTGATGEVATVEVPGE